jgi:glutamyl-tRNA reductase
MSLLVVGVSHHTAPVDLLEAVAVPAEATAAMLDALVAQPHVREAVVLSTCNRVEVYAAVTAFHGGLTEIGGVLAARAGLGVGDLAGHLYVHFETEAVRHALRVCAGLDSMVVGEAQILGQLRDAYGLAATHDAAGRFLHELMQQALRVGKRVHAETGIDRAGRSVVTAALGLAPVDLAGRPALVVGAGSLGALALGTLARRGAGPLYVTNRGAGRARRLAELHGAIAVDYADLVGALRGVDLVVCATASPDPVLTGPVVAEALRHRVDPDRRGDGSVANPVLTILDLAVPRDVSSEVTALPGVNVIDLNRVADASLDQPSRVDQAAAEQIVQSEVDAFLTWLRGADVAPTVAALRARADEVVASELARLANRRPELSPEQRAEVAHTVHRVVQRLLHSPTVRVRQLANTTDGDQAAAILRELFDLTVPAQHSGPDDGVSGDLGRAVAVGPVDSDEESDEPTSRSGPGREAGS